MKIFLDFIDENERARSLINLVSARKDLQGIVIRFSDNFIYSYSVVKTLKEKWERNNFFYDFSYPRYGRHRDESPFYFHRVQDVDLATVDMFAIQSFKQMIPEHIENNIFNPFEIILSIFNDSDTSFFYEVVSGFTGDRDFTVQIEKRSRNIFLNTRISHDPLVGGVSISSGGSKKYGTLGGFLTDKDGQKYGLTCGHVVDSLEVFQPASFDLPSNRKIGDVLYSSKLAFCDVDSPCNAEESRGNIDVAVIDIEESESCELSICELGAVADVKSFRDIIQGMRVEFNGRTTNAKKQLEIGGLCVSYKVAYQEASTIKYACFTNLIELRARPTQLFGTNYYLLESPVQPGDSGAWLCSNDLSGYSWCGMLVSGDADRGYFLASEHILKHLQENGWSFTL